MTLERSPIMQRRTRRLNSNPQSAVASSTDNEPNEPPSSQQERAPNSSKASKENHARSVDKQVEEEKCVKEKESKLKKGGDTQEIVSESGDLSPSHAKGKKTVQKLDDKIFKPWGGSCSRASSDTGSESAICKGGPCNMDCGNPVLNGQEGVKCDGCSGWFHDTCQGIEIPAIRALDRFKILSWFCAECKYEMKTRVEAKKVADLETKIGTLESVIQEHTHLVQNLLEDQKRASDDKNKELEQNLKAFQEEKKSYAEILKGTCDDAVRKLSEKVAALPAEATRNMGQSASSKTIQDMSVVFDDFLDKEKRKLNLVVHNMSESHGETLQERASKDAALFTTMLKDVFKLSVVPVKTFRVGKKLPDKPRLMIVTLNNESTKYDILKLAPQLRSTAKYSNIYINPDMTQKEREKGKALREELAARKRAGETNLTIRKGKIVPYDRSAEQTLSASTHQTEVRQEPASVPQLSQAVASTTDQRPAQAPTANAEQPSASGGPPPPCPGSSASAPRRD